MAFLISPAVRMDRGHNQSVFIKKRFFYGTLYMLWISFTGKASAYNCTDTKWSDNAEPCPDGMEEIFMNQGKYSGQSSRKCCIPGTQDAKNARLYADVCQETACAPKEALGQMDLCSVGLRYRLLIDGKEIKFVDSGVSDECMGPNGEAGKVGVQVLCCPQNSTDILLTTLYGTEKSEFPHFVRMGEGGCGGTVYNKRYVITASHCVTDETTNQVIGPSHPEWDSCCGTVRINIDIDKAYTENTYKVEEIIVHPESSRLQPLDEYGRLYNDIALLKLDRDIEFNEKVKALRIPDKGFDPLEYGDHAVIVGFGLSDALTYSKKRQKANLPIRPKDDVFSTPQMAFMKEYEDQLMFVGGIFKGDVQPSAGTGDSGGPAICRDAKGNAILCGITSFTPPIAECKEKLDQQSCFPSAYIDVQHFSDWIRSIAGDQSSGELLEQPLYGRTPSETEYPSNVHITSTGGNPCGGTMLSEDIAITAASCVADDDGNSRYNLKVSFSEGKEIDVKTIAVLDGFKRGDAKSRRRKRVVSLVLESWQKGQLKDTAIVEDPYYINNLALVKLTEKSGIMSFPKLSTVAPNDGDTGMEVAFTRKSNESHTLRERQFKLLSQSDCQARMDRLSPIGYNVPVDDNILCGVENYSGGSMCDRELGGGLFCNGELCGVQVFRTCEFNVPNAFVDVSSLRYWVDTAMNALSTM